MNIPTLWIRRLLLAERGWSTTLTLSQTGISPKSPDHFAVSLRAHRWHWRGRIAEIHLHEHGFLRAHDTDGALAAAQKVAERLDALCAQAEDTYVDAVPCQLADRGADGLWRLAENTTESLQGQAYDPDLEPTEDLPLDVTLCAGPDDQALRAALRALDCTQYVEDHIRPVPVPGATLRHCKNRLWGYQARMAFHSKNPPDRMAFQPRKITLDDLNETLCAGLIDAVANGLGALRAAKTRTHNGLPPGFLTREEFAANNRATRRHPWPQDQRD